MNCGLIIMKLHTVDETTASYILHMHQCTPGLRTWHPTPASPGLFHLSQKCPPLTAISAISHRVHCTQFGPRGHTGKKYPPRFKNSGHSQSEVVEMKTVHQANRFLYLGRDMYCNLCLHWLQQLQHRIREWRHWEVDLDPPSHLTQFTSQLGWLRILYQEGHNYSFFCSLPEHLNVCH